MIGDCNTEEEINDIKDQQLSSVLEQLQINVEEWDTDKCPAVK